jgi:hypothetical protein
MRNVVIVDAIRTPIGALGECWHAYALMTWARLSLRQWSNATG